jgi:formamidopyrimidine-DNA glycosylase
MPELPEVETIVRGLVKQVVGDRIESVWIGEKKNLLKSPAREIVSVLEHSVITGVRREGKHIVFELGGAGEWIVHLGMTGRLLIALKRTALARHTHLIATLRSRRELRYVDPRRLGRLSVTRSVFAAEGFEPLEIGLDLFHGLFRGRRTPVKSALLNQKLLRGVGNIYADEALFRAGIRPRRRASRITRDQFSRLYEAVREVLREAIEAGGSSVSNYVNADGEEGFFQLRHRVYQRTGDPCFVCKSPIKRVVLVGRGTHYCPNCQK